MSDKSVIFQREMLIFVWQNVRQISDSYKGKWSFLCGQISDFIKGNAHFCLTKCQTNQWFYNRKCSFSSDKISDKSVIFQKEMLIFVWQNVWQINDFIIGNAHFCLTKCQTNQWFFKGKWSFLSDKMSHISVILLTEMLIIVWQNVRQISDFSKGNAYFCLTKCHTYQ